ncbi:hypothetical protein ACFLZ6_02500 [Nanoarchaeota archaeon]
MNKKIMSMLSGLIVILLMSVSFVIAAIPEGPSTFDVKASTRRSVYPKASHNAYAGNVTHLVVAAQTVTQSWQGYVGNVTGTITLDDSSNYTLYDWSLGDPEGEIYATNASTVSWATGNVICWNWSDPVGSELQLTDIEGELGMAADDVDGVNETFTCDMCDERAISTTHTNFYVGGQLIDGSQTGDGDGPCPVTNLYNGTHVAGAHEEVILYEDTQNAIIYTSIIEIDKNGYNNQTWDFEMIVGEDGHNGDTGTTTYFFYVELE